MHNILSEFSAGGIGARLALGAVAAAILGAVVGSLLGYVWLGIGLGICVGVAIAAVSSHRVRRRHGDSEPEANRRDRSGASLASRDAAGQGEATYHSAGRAAITSGAVGIVAFAFLFAAVRTRTDIALSLSSPTYLMFKAHDVGSWGSS